MEPKDLIAQLFWLSEKEATDLVIKSGFLVRTVEKDGLCIRVSSDLQRDRLNLYVNNDKVYKARLG